MIASELGRAEMTPKQQLLAEITSAKTAADQAEAELVVAVRAARDGSCSWSTIAQALGKNSRQSAVQWFDRNDRGHQITQTKEQP